MIDKHTNIIINRTLREIKYYLDSENENSIKRENDLQQPRSYIAKLLWWKHNANLTKYLYIILHINEILKESYKFSYDYYRKKEYIKSFFGDDNLIDKYEIVYNMFSDNDSKLLFDYIICYRVAYLFLGEEAIKLYPLSIINNLNSNTIDNIKIKKIKKNLYQIKNYKIISTDDVIKGSWYEGQYYYKDICLPSKGDVVISCGAFMGETAIWLADKIGKNGKIYAFEPTLASYKILKKNIKKNNLEDIISIYNIGVWKNNKNIYFNDSNNLERKACNSIDKYNKSLKIKAISIDYLVEKEKMKRLNFIKMDIEGSEYEALCGMKKTLKKFKPILAISVYHKSDDLVKIPVLIKSIVPEYKIYFSQKNSYECIMFACY